MWNLPGPGIKPVSPALAGRFLSTAQPRKSSTSFFNIFLLLCLWKFLLWKFFKFFILKIVKLINLFHDSDLYIMLRRLSHIKIVQKFFDWVTLTHINKYRTSCKIVFILGFTWIKIFFYSASKISQFRQHDYGRRTTFYKDKQKCVCLMPRGKSQLPIS